MAPQTKHACCIGFSFKTKLYFIFCIILFISISPIQGYSSSSPPLHNSPSSQIPLEKISKIRDLFQQHTISSTTLTPNHQMASRTLSTIPSEMHFFGTLPRLDLGGKRVDSKFSPWRTSYLQSLAVMAIPFLCFAVVTVLVALIYMACKLRSSSSSPSRKWWITRKLSNLCCNINIRNNRTVCGVSLHRIRYRYLPRFFVVFIFSSICALVSLAMSSNSHIDEPILSAYSATTVLSQKLVLKERTILQHIAALNLTSLIPPDLEDIINLTTQVSLDLENHHEDVAKVLKIRQNINDGVGAFVIFIGILGAVSGLLRLRNVALITIFLGFLILPILWVLVAIYFPITVMVSDACPDPATVVTQSLDQEQVIPLVQYFSHCSGDEQTSLGPFDWLPSAFDDILEEIQSKLNEAIAKYPPNSAIIIQLTLVLQEARGIFSGILDMINCEYTAVAYIALTEGVCEKAFGDIFMITITSILTSILLCLGMRFIMSGLDSYLCREDERATEEYSLLNETEEGTLNEGEKQDTTINEEYSYNNDVEASSEEIGISPQFIQR